MDIIGRSNMLITLGVKRVKEYRTFRTKDFSHTDFSNPVTGLSSGLHRVCFLRFVCKLLPLSENQRTGDIHLIRNVYCITENK